MLNRLFNRLKPKNAETGQDTEKINCLFCNSSLATSFSSRADIVTCSSCGVTYLRTRPTQEAMYRIYQAYANGTSHMRPPDSIADAKQAGLRRRHLVDEITRLHASTTKGAWLDVGCGWGALLDEVRDRGYTPKGIELTRNCLDFASMQLNIPVSNSQFLDARTDANSCSILSMVHVLEHLPYPKQTLEKVYDTLEYGGMFCGIVPNIKSLCSEYLKDDWVWLDPHHHYVHYSPETLHKVLVEAGFSIERMYTDVGDYDYNTVIECISNHLPNVPTREKAQALIPQLMAEGRGEEIRFFARKVAPASSLHGPAPSATEKIITVQVCPCCNSSDITPLRKVLEYNYYRCLACNSLFIDTHYLSVIDNGGSLVKYEEGYWKMELSSARERAYGPSLARMAEAIYYCKRPVKKFLDIGTGPGYFLDAISRLLPDNAGIFYGVELFPPDIEFRTASNNYIIGELGDLKDKFDCGICIEVIEHLTPKTLDDIFRKLAGISNPEALYIFNTGMPDYVLHEDMEYLDPVKRGHLVSYSLKAIALLAGKYGFTVHQIRGKTWAFALEFTKNTDLPLEDIRDRIWHASPANLKILSDTTMGDALKILGMETSRAYN